MLCWNEGVPVGVPVGADLVPEVGADLVPAVGADLVPEVVLGALF